MNMENSLNCIERVAPADTTESQVTTSIPRISLLEMVNHHPETVGPFLSLPDHKEEIPENLEAISKIVTHPWILQGYVELQVIIAVTLLKQHEQDQTCTTNTRVAAEYILHLLHDMVRHHGIY